MFLAEKCTGMKKYVVSTVVSCRHLRYNMHDMDGEILVGGRNHTEVREFLKNEGRVS
jgi:hypothetical protein